LLFQIQGGVSLPLIQPGLGFEVYDGAEDGCGQLNTRTNTPAGIYTGMYP